MAACYAKQAMKYVLVAAQTKLRLAGRTYHHRFANEKEFRHNGGGVLMKINMVDHSLHDRSDGRQRLQVGTFAENTVKR